MDHAVECEHFEIGNWNKHYVFYVKYTPWYHHVSLLFYISFSLANFSHVLFCPLCRQSVVRKPLGELGKVSEEGERKEETAARYRTLMYLSKCTLIFHKL